MPLVCAIQFAPCTVEPIAKHRRKVPACGSRRTTATPSKVSETVGVPALEDTAAAWRVSMRLRGCMLFAWGPEEEARWLASHLGEEEIAAMVSAVEEDGWGAWVG